MKSGFWVLKLNAKSGNGFHFREIRPHSGFQLRKPKTDFMDYLEKSILLSSRVFFLLIMRARARPLFLRTVCQILFRISQKSGKKGNPRTGVSALKSFCGFRFRLQIRITLEALITDTLLTGKLLLSSTFTKRRSKSRFPNRTQP